uniref:Uncharacterized protein n=1 Tax=Populus alba TaxID=43335 RepID=A0A4U5NQF4_POPAL|nr:hypothetical protein D5086_0000252640 [Populus alba]
MQKLGIKGLPARQRLEAKWRETTGYCSPKDVPALCSRWEPEMVTAAMAGRLTVRKGSEGWCLRGIWCGHGLGKMVWVYMGCWFEYKQGLLREKGSLCAEGKSWLRKGEER